MWVSEPLKKACSSVICATASNHVRSNHHAKPYVSVLKLWRTACSSNGYAKSGNRTHRALVSNCGDYARQCDLIAGRAVRHIWGHESDRARRSLSCGCRCRLPTFVAAMPSGRAGSRDQPLSSCFRIRLDRDPLGAVPLRGGTARSGSVNSNSRKRYRAPGCAYRRTMNLEEVAPDAEDGKTPAGD